MCRWRAGRPAAQIVQALHWLRDTLSEQRDAVTLRLQRLLASDASGMLKNDLLQGLPTLPGWMQDLLREILQEADAAVGSQANLKTPMSAALPAAQHVAQGVHK